jgi:2-keto-4-pentenoate hydratase/2-oxohepta-3-ene-1,7-dioic acid hydratase in catechol pathway
MKLASFEVDTEVGRVRRVGAVAEDTLVDLTAGYAAALAAEGDQSPVEVAETVVPSSMSTFLRRGDRALSAAREAVTFVTDTEVTEAPDGARLRYDPDDVRLLSPLPRPNSIRDFMVFEEHVRNSLEGEIPDVWYDIPVYYKGNPDAIVHPGDDVEWPTYTERLDYELELCAVVGKGGRDIPAAEATDHIAGFTIFNDFSARDIQMREMEGKLGPTKGKDFANGFGPYLVTADEIDIENLPVTARVNGEVWSEGNTGEMYHTFPEILEYVSQHESIHPGDVLGTGTVGRGCGLELDRWLSPGDVVELEAEGIGTLRHRVVKPE